MVYCPSNEEEWLQPVGLLRMLRCAGAGETVLTVYEKKMADCDCCGDW